MEVKKKRKLDARALLKLPPKPRCSVCGGNEDTEEEISIFHRGCRFKKAFGEDSYRREGNLLIFDMKKIEKKLKEKK